MAILESIGIAALGWLVSPIVGKLLNEGFKSLGIGTEKKLEELRVTVLPLLKSVIEKAEGSAYRSEVEDWLQRLKDAYDDAEDELDLLNYCRLEREAANRVRTFRLPKPPKRIMDVLKVGQDMISPQKIKLKNSLNKLEKIAGEALKLRDLLGVQPVPESRQTISVPPPKVFGRDKDRDEIIWRLKVKPAAIAAIYEPGPSDISIIARPSVIPIIAIVGRSGIGKTTLAQYVCQQLRRELGDKHFDLIMWVYASHNFNISKIMKKIIQQAFIASEPQYLVNSNDASEPQYPVNSNDLPRMVLSHLLNLDTMVVGSLGSPEELQLKMNKMLNAKKFLIVIDDVWCNGEDHKINWDTLFRCLSNCCSPESKILVTSQTDDAPRKIVAASSATLGHIHELKELEENNFLDLFIHHALPGGGEIDSSLRKDLEEGCKTIAKKLNKDPTAAKIVGETIALKLADLLRSKGDWRTYLRTIAEKDWSGDKTKALMWSYLHLPAHLQRCFSYCSLYPRGYKFQALELVQFWMAQGFIKPDDHNKRMADVGNDYLEMLVSRFYIQHELFSSYTLHELLYDLAEKVSHNNCVRIEGNHQNKIPSTIQHLSIQANKLNEKKEEICKLTKLRTLIVTKGESDTSEENVATDIFNSLKKLRALVFELNIGNLAEFIGEMKHLRVLRVPVTSKSVLLESVCTLYQLQMLAGDFYLRKEKKGNELEHLQNLNELRGCLWIANLETVKSKESAIAANLKEKKHLDELKLKWSNSEDNVNSNLDVEILEGLQLPPYLTSLSLDGYRGRSCPSWPKCQTCNIQNLTLLECKMLEELPPMDQLYPSCISLFLSNLCTLKALHTLPPRLQKINIDGTPFLTFATNEDLQMSTADKTAKKISMRNSMSDWFLHQHQKYLVDNERKMRNFIAARNDSNMDITVVWGRWLESHEEKMELIYNGQNEAKLLLPSTLTDLFLKGCNITDHALSACLQTLTSLTRMSLREIQTITCLPSEDVLGNLKALEYLEIWRCWALISLGGIRSLPGLTDLNLHECPYLNNETPFLPSKLEKITFSSCADVALILANADLPYLSDLTIRQCHMLEKASLQFGNLPSLRFSSIWNCSGLSFSVNVQELHSLELLDLRNCSNLQEVMNIPRSNKCLRISECPILERSINIDPSSGVRTLGAIPVSIPPP